MSNNKDKKQSCQEILADVKEEMAGPLVPESMQIEAESQYAATVKKGDKS